MFIAHRGLVDQNTQENSLKAFKKAFNSNKYIGVECDIRVSKDKRFIIVHDPLINGHLVKNTSYKELKKHGVILLKDLLKIKTNKIILVEIKDHTINKSKLINLLNRYNQRVYLMSFNKNFIKDIKLLNPKFKLGYLNYVLNSESNYQLYDFICLLNDLITPKIIDYFKKQNIELFSYGIFKKINFRKDIKYIIDDKVLSQ